MFNKIRNFRIHLVLLLALLGSVMMATPVFAAGITVDTVADEDGTPAVVPSAKRSQRQIQMQLMVAVQPDLAQIPLPFLLDALHAHIGSQLPTVSNHHHHRRQRKHHSGGRHCEYRHLPRLRSDRWG